MMEHLMRDDTEEMQDSMRNARKRIDNIEHNLNIKSMQEKQARSDQAAKMEATLEEVPARLSRLEHGGVQTETTPTGSTTGGWQHKLRIIGGWQDKTDRSTIEEGATLFMLPLPDKLQARCLQPWGPLKYDNIAKVKVSGNLDEIAFKSTRVIQDRKMQHGTPRATSSGAQWSTVQRQASGSEPSPRQQPERREFGRR